MSATYVAASVSSVMVPVTFPIFHVPGLAIQSQKLTGRIDNRLIDASCIKSRSCARTAKNRRWNLVWFHLIQRRLSFRSQE